MRAPAPRSLPGKDSAFCRHRILDWCERNDVRYVVGLARNAMFEREVQMACEVARDGFEANRPCPDAMPNASPSATQDRRRGHPKYPHRGCAPFQHLPRPGRVPAPGAPADRRIAPLSSATSPSTTSNPIPERRGALRIARAAQEVLKCHSAPLRTDPPALQSPDDSSKILQRGPNCPPRNKIASFVQHV